MLYLANNRVAIKIRELHALLGDDRKIAVPQEEQVASVIEDSGHI